MFEWIIIATVLHQATSLKCRKSLKDGSLVINTNQPYCSFLLPPPCEKGKYVLGSKWKADSKPKEECIIAPSGAFSCVCYKDFCASEVSYVMEIWKRSPQYSATNRYTNCLTKIIEDAKKYGNGSTTLIPNKIQNGGTTTPARKAKKKTAFHRNYFSAIILVIVSLDFLL
ncbi:hypothetical protein RB195_015586 [Necator americanus]|uniref:Uncharacterized protein n=1 Tax=Necator americanus TaxID=51031 RepID=A0ABR1E5Q4_NECAM